VRRNEAGLDVSEVSICSDLPLLAGKTPPDACPICGQGRIEPEDSGMSLPEGSVVYSCLASYAPAASEVVGGAQAWEPLPPCWSPPPDRSLATIRDWCLRKEEYESVGRLLAQSCREPAPLALEDQPGLWLRPPDLQSEHPPEGCLICGMPVSKRGEFIVSYECQSLLMVRAKRPTASGLYIPERWGGELPCRNPPLHLVLTVLARSFPAHSVRQEACLKAARLLEKAKST
jgi:hypothetical protein